MKPSPTLLRRQASNYETIALMVIVGGTTILLLGPLGIVWGPCFMMWWSALMWAVLAILTRWRAKVLEKIKK